MGFSILVRIRHFSIQTEIQPSHQVTVLFIINIANVIISKTRAHRIEKIITSIIYPDQTGFTDTLPATHTGYSIKCNTHHKNEQEPSLPHWIWKKFATLKSFVFRESFTNWIKTLDILYTFSHCHHQSTKMAKFHNAQGDQDYTATSHGYASLFPQKLVGLHFTPLVITINDHLPPLSIMGSIPSVKMIILPKMNYNLFSIIPTHPTLTWLSSLDSTISTFYWKNKTPRSKLTTREKSQNTRRLAGTTILPILSSQPTSIYTQMDPPKPSADYG